MAAKQNRASYCTAQFKLSLNQNVRFSVFQYRIIGWYQFHYVFGVDSPRNRRQSMNRPKCIWWSELCNASLRKLREHQNVTFVCFTLLLSLSVFPKLLSLVSVKGLPGILGVPTILRLFLHPRLPLCLCESAVRGSESITEINGALRFLAQKASCPFTPDCAWAE